MDQPSSGKTAPKGSQERAHREDQISSFAERQQEQTDQTAGHTDDQQQEAATELPRLGIAYQPPPEQAISWTTAVL
ncbi:hypothetical protein ACFEMC_10605 [Kineococcus sp. DHX-1]|uniref:hypothetical protein n=1 Tax=Kineococcus sp. DHX-1 TaxID=3349638 RepID=UPI0036D2EAF8